MKKLTVLSILFLGLALPYVVYAQTFDILLFRIGFWVNTATPIVAGLALLVFFYGLVKFIWNGGDEEKRKEGKMAMLWGIIAIFVMVSIWGIVFFLSLSFGTTFGGSVSAPCLRGLPGCLY